MADVSSLIKSQLRNHILVVLTPANMPISHKYFQEIYTRVKDFSDVFRFKYIKKENLSIHKDHLQLIVQNNGYEQVFNNVFLSIYKYGNIIIQTFNNVQTHPTDFPLTTDVDLIENITDEIFSNSEVTFKFVTHVYSDDETYYSIRLYFRKTYNIDTYLEMFDPNIRKYVFEEKKDLTDRMH